MLWWVSYTHWKSTGSINSYRYISSASALVLPKYFSPTAEYSITFISLSTISTIFGEVSITRLAKDSDLACINGMHMFSSAFFWNTAMAFSRQVGYPQAPQFNSSSGRFFPVSLRIARISSSVGIGSLAERSIKVFPISTSTSIWATVLESTGSFLMASSISIFTLNWETVPGSTVGPWIHPPSQLFISIKQPLISPLHMLSNRSMQLFIP